MEIYLEQMAEILEYLFCKYKNKFDNPGILLSGGIDSSTIAQLVNNHFNENTILSFGTKKTKDRPFVELFCKNTNKNYEWIEIEKNDILENKNTVIELLKKISIDANTMQISLATGYFLVFKKAQKLGIKTIFTGQGPDILLGGYSMYKKIIPSEINAKIETDLPLLVIDGKRDNAMADYFGIKLINPYLEKEFVNLSLKIPGEYKINNNIEKYILRKFAEKIGVPKEIVNRPKKAFQYSTGIQDLYQSIN
jgi:asparagine synthase (glutamine-hydrolysing)